MIGLFEVKWRKIAEHYNDFSPCTNYLANNDFNLISQFLNFLLIERERKWEESRVKTAANIRDHDLTNFFFQFYYSVSSIIEKIFHRKQLSEVVSRLMIRLLIIQTDTKIYLLSIYTKQESTMEKKITIYVNELTTWKINTSTYQMSESERKAYVHAFAYKYT